MDFNQDLMLQMMQMLNQNQMLMGQLMMSMAGQQPVSQSATSVTPDQASSAAKVDLVSQSEVQSLTAQIDELQAQIQNLKSQLDAQTKRAETAEAEAKQLRLDLSKLEAYEGRSADSLLDEAENMTGEEFYQRMKKKWYGEGKSGKEMHKEVKAFRNAFHPEEEKVDTTPDVPMVDFSGPIEDPETVSKLFGGSEDRGMSAWGF